MDLTVTPAANDRLQAGREACAGARWEDACEHFQASLRAGESAEAWEGLGMAAVWLQDSSRAIAALESAFRAYRARGEDGAAGRVAVFLSTCHSDLRGDFAVAHGWFERARRLIEGRGERGPEYGLLRGFEAHVALLTGNDPVRARRLAAEALEIARAGGALDWEMMTLALDGLARVVTGEVAEGMRQIDEAVAAATAGEISDLNALTNCCCYLIHACEQVRDYDRAAQWCERLQEICRRWQMAFMFTTCRLQYGSVLVEQGEWARAEAELGAALEELRRARPSAVAAALVRLADLRRRQGRHEDARALLADAEHHRLAPLFGAALALDEGDAARATDLADRFLRRVPADARAERVAGLDVLARAAAAAGDLAGARAAASELGESAARLGTEPIRACAAMAAAAVAAAEGDPERARRHLEDAADLFGQGGVPFEAARARLALAETLASLERAAAAREEARAAQTSFERLGAVLQAGRAAALLCSLEADTGPTGGAESGSAGDSPLTRRQRAVLALVAEGLSDRQIGERLFLSEYTVHRHLANILGRLGVTSRSAAVARALRDGLL